MRLCAGNEWKGILKNWACPLVGMTLTFPKTSSTASRAVTLEGEPWFVAADVCRALGIDNTATRRLDEDEKAALRLTQTSSNGTEQGRDVTIVNEPGLYSLVLASRKPEAKAFKRWITHEVIPSIRKTGGYIAGQETMDDDQLLANALGYARPNDAIAAHCRATVKRSTPISGKIQEINFISEGDVYRLITHSKLPAAEKFESWVFDEVIPSIRKTGG